VLNAGLFFADTGRSRPILPPSLFDSSTHASGRITYHVFLVSDVSLGGQLYTNAKIHLSFRSHTSEVGPLPGAGPNAYVNPEGTARVEITKGSTTISARFAPDQIYVFFDPSTAPGVGSVGFGSYSGGRAYPVTLTQCSCNSPQLLGAVSDIITNAAPATNYTPKTATLVTDLTNATVLADFASSCSATALDPAAFDPTTSICSNLCAPAKLTTDKGDFYLYEPYTQDFSTPPSNPQPFSNNWAIFWSTFNSRGESGDE
jgi:hypothetical protein